MKYPLFKVFVDVEQSLKNMREVLESGYVAEGTWSKSFEDEVNKFLNIENGVLVNSCTSALTLALRLAEVGHGDEVITTSYTCLAGNTPIIDVGAKPVWADINRNTGMIDPAQVEQKITSRTKAIMFVDWAGIPADLEWLQEISRHYGIPLIQDAAHAFGSKYNNKDISEWSDFTCFSFQAIKHLTSLDGGLLVCKNKLLKKRAKDLRWFGIDRSASKNSVGEWKGQAWHIDVPEAGYKYHMNNGLASIGLANLSHMKKIISAHVNNAEQYKLEFLNDTKNNLIKPLDIMPYCQPSYWVYTVLLDEKVNRDAVMEDLNKLGIGAALVHVPNHPYSCFKDFYEDLPETDYFYNHQISLPCGWWLNEYDINHIANTLKGLCDRHK